MAILYGTNNVDEMYSPIVEPNLYANSILIPGVTYTDKYEIGPAGQIFIYKYAKIAVSKGTPGRDFTNTEATNVLIPITLDENYLVSEKIRNVKAAAVSHDLGMAKMEGALLAVTEQRQLDAYDKLYTEATAVTPAAQLTDIDALRAAILADRATLRTNKAKPDVLVVSPAIYTLLLEEGDNKFRVVSPDQVFTNIREVREYFGMLVFEYEDMASINANAEYIMYDHDVFSVIDNLNTMRIKDSELFNGSLAQVEINSGFKVTDVDGTTLTSSLRALQRTHV